MGDLDADSGFAPHADGFFKRLDQASAFASHVGGVDAAMPLDPFGQREDFPPRSIHARRIDEAGTQAAPARLETLLQQPLHSGDFICRCGAPHIAHHGGAEDIVSHQRHNIDCGLHLFEEVPVVRHGGPGAGVGMGLPVGGHPRLAHLRGGGGAAVAHHFRGDALIDLAGRGGLDEQIGV